MRKGQAEKPQDQSADFVEQSTDGNEGFWAKQLACGESPDCQER